MIIKVIGALLYLACSIALLVKIVNFFFKEDSFIFLICAACAALLYGLGSLLENK